MGSKPSDNPSITRSQGQLTQQQFQRLLQRLHAHSDRAAEKYEEIRWKLIKFFQWDSCSDAEELTDETLDRVARKLDAGEEEILNVEAFVWGVAKWVRQEGKKRDFRIVRLSDAPDYNLTDVGLAQ